MAPRRPHPLVNSPPSRPENDPESEEVSQEEEEEEEGEVGESDDGSHEEEEGEGEDEQSPRSNKSSPVSHSRSDSVSNNDSDQAPAKPVEHKSTVNSKKLTPSKLAGSKRPAEAEPSGSVSDWGSDSESDSRSDQAPAKPVEPNPRVDSKNLKQAAEAEPGVSISKKKKKKKNKLDAEEMMKKDISGEEKKKTVMGADEKKSPFQRKWTDADEIALLNGFIRFQATKVIKSSDDMTEFHDFIKESLSVGMSKSQVFDKIRRIKRKFLVNEGKNPVSSKPHDRQVFELSTKIWGRVKGKKKVETDVNEANAVVEYHKIPNSEAPYVCADPEMFWSQYPLIKKSLTPEACEAGLAIKAIKLLGPEKTKEMEDAWYNFYLELYKRKTELMTEQNRVMLDVLNHSND